MMLYINGRSLDEDIKVDSVNLAPNAKVVIGAPNPAVAVSGVVRGKILTWDLGPNLLVSYVLTDMDATGIFVHGPGSHKSLICFTWTMRSQCICHMFSHVHT